MGSENPRSLAEKLDDADPLAALRDEFVAAADDTIYLDGNSLGRLPAAAPAFLASVISQGWGVELVRSWSTWVDWGRQLGDRLAAHVLGAQPGEVVLSDSTSVNLYKLAAAALDAAPGRGTVLIDAEDFPTDRYLVQGLADSRRLRLRTLRSDLDNGLELADLAAALDRDVALVVLSLVSYRSGALLDMAAVNRTARAVGATVLWDLSHAVGAVPVHLDESGADLAVGCTYKYLNGGPGSPAFLYVRRSLQPSLRQPIWGWFGQREQFQMRPVYHPVDTVDRFLVGTPPVLSMAALDPALRTLERVDMRLLREKSIGLSSLVVKLADRWLAPHGFRLASPRDPRRRGGHVTLTHPDALRVCRALAAHGVVCDYRVPDRLRIAPVAAYTRFVDVWDAMSRLADIAERREYLDHPEAPSRIT
jgi:kynureninase